ncbi:MAG: SDR family oxidoreductase [Dehalococcoidia bacterium]|nr:MAG: SDR family oxidoreductase [Dehalococcoidia bacterium]
MIGSKDSYALVTGASYGIGYELAKIFAKDAKNIVVVARSQDRLEGLKAEIESEYGTSVMVLPKDLSDPNSPQEIFSELEKGSIKVDVLVNNAGFGVYGMFYQTDLQEELRLIQVNATSLIHLTKLFLKGMVENGSGSILNVASLCSFMSGPMESVYCATKALVLHFSEALANELQGTGVTVTCLCPGLAKTEFHKRAHMENTKAGKRKMMDAGTVAEAGYKALKRGQVIVIPGLVYKFGQLFARFAPRGLVTRVVRSQHEPA